MLYRHYLKLLCELGLQEVDIQIVFHVGGFCFIKKNLEICKTLFCT